MDAFSAPRAVPDAGRCDLFLSFNSLDREQVQALRRLLESRGVSTFLDRENLVVGQPWFDALQDAIDTARGMAVFIGKDGLGRWQKREMALALDRQSREEKAGRAFPVVPVLLPQADPEKAPGFLLLNTFVDLRGKLDDPDALDALVRAVRGEAAPPPAQTTAALCPYRGLRVFREEDAPLFFGREVFADGLLEKTRAHPLVAVVGPSGSGKSSVVQAGLLPLLRRQRPPDPSWESVIFTPGKRPFHSLAAALVPLWETERSETQRLIEAEELGTRLASGTVALEAALDQALRKSVGTDRLLLVMDQFEELFTQTPEADRRGFMDALLRGAADRPVTIILTLRADFYGQAIGLSRELSDGMQRALVNLGPMTRDELRRAVENPAGVVGLSFEPGLVDRILDDVEGQPGSLPLLEFALTELWERREGASLTHRKYDEIGRVQGAISRRAEEQFAKLSPEQQEVALRVFARLVRVSSAQEEGTDTRQRVRLDALDSPARAVVQSFVAARLLVTGRREGSDEETIEVAHEALIRNWDRLRRLLNEDREFLLWRQRLGLQLSEWERTQRDAGALLRGVSLSEARRWARERPEDLNERERAFIRSSELAARRPRRYLVVGIATTSLLLMVLLGYAISDHNQIRIILSEAPELVPKSESAVGSWMHALVFAGRSEEAVAAAREIDPPRLRVLALAGVASALAKVSRVEKAHIVAGEAVAAARNIDHSGLRALALAQAASALTRAAKAEEVKIVADEVVAAGPKIEDLSLRVSALTEAASALARAGNAEEAVAAARKIDPLTLRALALAGVASALARAGKVEGLKTASGEALTTALRIEDPYSRVVTLAGVASALIKAGKAEEVKIAANETLATARRIEEPLNRASALAQAASTLANARKAKEALATAQEIEDPRFRAYALAQVVSVLAKAGKPEEVLAVAQRIKYRDARSGALCAVAGALADMGIEDKARRTAEEALDTAKRITIDEQRSQALAEISEVFAQLGLFRHARQTAKLITSSNDKLDAYAAILLEYRDPEAAKLLRAEKAEAKEREGKVL